MANNNLVMNEALELSYKISLGKRKKFLAQSWLETINDSKITANSRIKVSKKVVNSLYNERGVLIKDPDTLKELLMDQFVEKLYKNQQRKNKFEKPFTASLPPLDTQLLRNAIKEVNTKKATGCDGIPMKYARTL